MNIRLLYLYLFAFIGLLIVVIGAVQLVDLALTVLVFPDSDNYGYYPPVTEQEGQASAEELEGLEVERRALEAANQTRQRQRQLITALSMLLVGAPLYLYHWGIIKREGAGSQDA